MTIYQGCVVLFAIFCIYVVNKDRKSMKEEDTWPPGGEDLQGPFRVAAYVVGVLFFLAVFVMAFFSPEGNSPFLVP